MAKFEVLIRVEEVVAVNVDVPDDEIESDAHGEECAMEMAIDKVRDDLFGADLLGQDTSYVCEGVEKQ